MVRRAHCCEGKVSKASLGAKLNRPGCMRTWNELRTLEHPNPAHWHVVELPVPLTTVVQFLWLRTINQIIIPAAAPSAIIKPAFFLPLRFCCGIRAETSAVEKLSPAATHRTLSPVRIPTCPLCTDRLGFPSST